MQEIAKTNAPSWRLFFGASSGAHIGLFLICFFWPHHEATKPIRITIDLISHGDHEEPPHEPPAAAPKVAPPKEAAAPAPVAKAAAPSTAPVAPAQTAPHDAPQDNLPKSGGEKAGKSGPSPNELSLYVSNLVKMLEKVKVYPRDAQLREESGVVELHVELAADGSVVKSAVEKPSVFSALNKAALDTIARAGKLPAPPGGAGITLHVPIHFKLDR